MVALLLAGCGERQPDAVPTGGERVECAPAGAMGFALVCPFDRERDGEGLILTVHNPDGGFHRLRVTTDGRGVVAADGAEAAAVAIRGDAIEVAIGKDRYRLPATVR